MTKRQDDLLAKIFLPFQTVLQQPNKEMQIELASIQQ